MTALPIPLVGDGVLAPCLDGNERPYLSFDAAASTPALPSVLAKVEQFLPWYSSVHRGAGYKSQLSTAAYEDARDAALEFCGRTDTDDIAIICRNTTEAINHLAYRMGLSKSDVVLTTVVEHHANLLPWSRVATCRYVECGVDGTFDLADVIAGLDASPRPKLLAITGASNITGWMPRIEQIIDAAHERGVQVALDAAQLAPHRPLPRTADYVAFSGHKMYAPFGSGVLIGPRSRFAEGDPFLVGGGAVDLVDLHEVAWTTPPEREEAGSPNVIGAVALHGAIEAFADVGWPSLIEHDRSNARRLREGLASIDGVSVLGPPLDVETLPAVAFVIDGLPHALVAARLSLEHGIGVRHGCFCAHPYLTRLLGLGQDAIDSFRADIRRGDHSRAPGAVRVSAGINIGGVDVDRLLGAVAQIASGAASPVEYELDLATGDYLAPRSATPWLAELNTRGSSCAPG